jgi:RNA polymerase sigma-70 factor (ECF subfamily)
VDEFADRIYRYVLVRTRDKELAKDIVQECFANLWEKHKDVSYEKVKSYLFTSAYHQIVDYYRKNKRNERLDVQMNNQYNYSENFDNKNIQKILHQFLEKLPDIQQDLILLRDYEGYEYKEIAEITGLSESQVKVYLFRAREKLRQMIGKIEYLI